MRRIPYEGTRVLFHNSVIPMSGALTASLLTYGTPVTASDYFFCVVFFRSLLNLFVFEVMRTCAFPSLFMRKCAFS